MYSLRNSIYHDGRIILEGFGFGRGDLVSGRQKVPCLYRSIQVEELQNHLQHKPNDRARPTAFARQSFTEPQWLLPIREGDDGENSTSRKPENTDFSMVFYKIQLTTSNDPNSGLSNINAGILLSMLGEHGASFIYRISPIEDGETATVGVEGDQRYSKVLGQVRFQRGSVDVVTFSGPDLGRLVALWIAPEAGTWRLDEANVTIFPSKKNVVGNRTATVEDGIEQREFKCLHHIFQCKGMLIGDGNCIPAVELKPSHIHECDWAAPSKVQIKKSEEERAWNTEQGLEDYEVLKASLLSYHSFLVTAGTLVWYSFGMESVAKSFATGGIGGFLYLFFLQSAVDQLPGSYSTRGLPNRVSYSAPDHSQSYDGSVEKKTDGKKTNFKMNEEDREVSAQGDTMAESQNSIYQTVEGQFSGFRAPITRFSGVSLLVFLGTKIVPGISISNLTPQELLAGVAGFFLCKVAVLFAAYRPFPFKK